MPTIGVGNARVVILDSFNRRLRTYLNRDLRRVSAHGALRISSSYSGKIVPRRLVGVCDLRIRLRYCRCTIAEIKSEHTYQAAGNYFATVTATDPQGAVSTN